MQAPDSSSLLHIYLVCQTETNGRRCESDSNQSWLRALEQTQTNALLLNWTNALRCESDGDLLLTAALTSNAAASVSILTQRLLSNMLPIKYVSKYVSK